MRYFGIIIILLLVSCAKNDQNKKFSFFERVEKVRLISYPSRTTWDFSNGRIHEKVRFKNNELIFDNSKILDDLILTSNQKEDVFKILGDKKYNENGMQAACYDPRHLFLFYSKNKIIGYYEVCLECGGWDCSKELDSLPMFCIEKGEEMKKVFIKMGLVNTGEGSPILSKTEKY